MRLFRFELKKLLWNKRMIIILLVLFVAFTGIGIANIIMPFKGAGTYDQYIALADQMTGKIDNEQAEKSMQEVKELQDLYGTGHMVERMSSTNGQLKFDFQYNNFANRVKAYYYGTNSTDGEITGIEPLRQEISRLESLGEGNSYQYKKLTKQLEVEESIGEPEFYDVTSWDSLFEEWGGIFIVFLLFYPIAFLIAPVYTKEAVTGMDNIILSSKNGRGKLVFAKLGAVAVTCTVVTLIYFLGTFLGTFIPFLSLHGGNQSVRGIASMMLTQLNINISSFGILTVLWVLFVAIVFGFMVSFVSCKLKSHAAVFGIGIILLMFNMIIEALGTEIVDILDIVVKLGFIQTASSITIFGGTTTFDVFGMVIPYYVIAFLGLVVLGALSVLGIFHSQKRRTIA